MIDISKSLIDATIVVKLLKEKSSAKSNEDLYQLEMHGRALRQISNDILAWIANEREVK